MNINLELRLERKKITRDRVRKENSNCLFVKRIRIIVAGEVCDQVIDSGEYSKTFYVGNQHVYVTSYFERLKN